MKNLIRKILREDDFDWHIETPTHRFFDVGICYYSEYDEETGEDECADGGSYFLKIPEEGIEEIWSFETEDEYMAGPADEGRGVIDWAINNKKPNVQWDVEYFEYVREVTKKEFCMAVGHGEHSDICGENNEIGKGVWSESIEDSDWDFIKDITNTFNPMTQIMFNPPLNLRVEDDLLKTLLVDLSDSNYWKWNGGGSLLDYGWIDRYSRIVMKNDEEVILIYSINLGAAGDVTRTTGTRSFSFFTKPGYTQINGREMYS